MKTKETNFVGRKTRKFHSGGEKWEMLAASRPSCAVLSAILRDEYLTSAVRTRKIALKTAREGEKT